jgi:hypothetical protein
MILSDFYGDLKDKKKICKKTTLTCDIKIADVGIWDNDFDIDVK